MQFAHHVLDVGVDAQGAAKGRRVGEAEHIRQDLDTAHESVFQQFFLGGDQMMLQQARRQGSFQDDGRTGFGQEAEYGIFIDRAHGGFDIRIPGEHDTNRLRRDLADMRKELHSVHTRHAHVGDHHGVRAIFLDVGQPRFPAQRHTELKVFVQYALVTLQHGQFIIDKEYLLVHEEPLAAASFLS